METTTLQDGKKYELISIRTGFFETLEELPIESGIERCKHLEVGNNKVYRAFMYNGNKYAVKKLN